MKLLIQGGSVFNHKKRTIEAADILIDNDRIVAVEPKLDVPSDIKSLDATGEIILPGLINAHTHSHNNLMKGIADNWTLEDLLNHGPALYTNRSVEDQYLSAAIGAVEMIKTGCTAAYDMFMAVPVPTDEGIEAVVRAYADVGLRTVIAPAMTDIVFYRAVPGLLDLLPSGLHEMVENIKTAPTEELLHLSENAVRRWDGYANGRIRVNLSPSIPTQCSDHFLVGYANLLRKYSVGLHTHLAETKVQAISAQRRWGKTIVAKLSELGLLGPSFVGAHGIWLTTEDISLLADTGAGIAHNPASNLRLGSGIAPIREMLDQGIYVGLGTDGSLASDNQNMFEAMRFASLVGTIRFPYEQGCWMGAQTVWEMATSGSARVLGMVEDIGSISPGRKADLILLKANSTFLQPMNDVLGSLVYAETGADVDIVLIDGHVVLEKGRMLTINEDRLRSQAQEASNRLRIQNSPAWLMANQFTPYLSKACQAIAATPYPINRYFLPQRS